ncbi:MAG: MgtC/SapB family protein [Dorea sp.]|jgi:putative Mg2+ transporter-C (MgtC) family protein|nr:MgtC/SapB family protein [Dorea sp.]MCI9271863.1 MgtC/SapB family protein [Dorea sp.]
MLTVFDGIREFSFLSIALRILLSSVSAGLIGFERGRAGRAAGLRTHILVSLGACIVMCVDHYLVTAINPAADPARLGAQVINGMGFLGAGTILATGKRVTGLTTAAGLWTTACIGLAYGGGYFEGGLLATATMLVVMIILHKLEGHSSTLIGMELLIEITVPEDIPCVLDTIRTCEGHVINISINDDSKKIKKGHILLRLSLKVGRTFDSSELLDALSHKIPVAKFEEL